MKIHVNARALQKGLQVSFFCLITGPATLLFCMLMLSSVQGSISGGLLSTMRVVIGTGTPGQVWDCLEQPADSLPVPGNSASAGIVKVPVATLSCERQLVNEDVWAARSDKKMKIFYLFTVFLSAIGIVGMRWLTQAYRQVLNSQFFRSQKP